MQEFIIGVIRLLHSLSGFRQDEFDVAWVGHVWVDLETSVPLQEFENENIHDREHGMSFCVALVLG